MDAIRMMGIVKCFGPVRANDGIDLIVKQQEIHCLLGENGTGKSTLLNIISNRIFADSGSAFITRMQERSILMKRRHRSQIQMMLML